MEGMIGDILGVGISGVAGGALGVLGAGLKVFGEYFRQKQLLAQQAQQYAHELALLDKQILVKNAETESEDRVAGAALRGQSYGVFTDTSDVHQVVANILALTRVAILIVLWILVAWIFYRLTQSGGIPYVDSKAMIKEIVMTVVFCASSATLWWYGDRPARKA